MYGLIYDDSRNNQKKTRANINLPTIMIGERFGEWFREGAI
jgi:hypothetical protein